MSRNMRDSPRPSTDKGAQAEATHGECGEGAHPRGPHATPATSPRRTPAGAVHGRPLQGLPRCSPRDACGPRGQRPTSGLRSPLEASQSGLLGNLASTGSHRRSSPPLPLRGSAPLRPYLRRPACLRAAASRVSCRFLWPRCLLGGCEAKASGAAEADSGPAGWTSSGRVEFRRKAGTGLRVGPKPLRRRP